MTILDALKTLTVPREILRLHDSLTHTTPLESEAFSKALVACDPKNFPDMKTIGRALLIINPSHLKRAIANNLLAHATAVNSQLNDPLYPRISHVIQDIADHHGRAAKLGLTVKEYFALLNILVTTEDTETIIAKLREEGLSGLNIKELKSVSRASVLVGLSPMHPRLVELKDKIMAVITEKLTDNIHNTLATLDWDRSFLDLVKHRNQLLKLEASVLSFKLDKTLEQPSILTTLINHRLQEIETFKSATGPDLPLDLNNESAHLNLKSQEALASEYRRYLAERPKPLTD
ncbi:MAG: hypothetical protein V4534_02545 [Myxococcota bacterium]